MLTLKELRNYRHTKMQSKSQEEKNSLKSLLLYQNDTMTIYDGIFL